MKKPIIHKVTMNGITHFYFGCNIEAPANYNVFVTYEKMIFLLGKPWENYFVPYKVTFCLN
jgi:hypothetical protein